MKSKNLFNRRGNWITGGIFFVIGSFITYVFKGFCFDACPSSADVLKVFFIFAVGGFVFGYLISLGINFLVRRNK